MGYGEEKGVSRKLRKDGLALEKEAGQRAVRTYYGRTAGTLLALDMALIGSVA